MIILVLKSRDKYQADTDLLSNYTQTYLRMMEYITKYKMLF